MIIGDFNTSHVTVYPSIHRYIICHDRISIHLMLRFIQNDTLINERKEKISIHLMLRFIPPTKYRTVLYLHFNTSHVTVYQDNGTLQNGTNLFQYISCYGLSRAAKVFLNYCIEFQYISCYGLSVPVIAPFFTSQFQYISCYGLSQFSAICQQAMQDFNTSHVTVYQFHYNHTDLLFHHFNTSHVTVYPTRTITTTPATDNFNTSHVTVYHSPNVKK